jgi:hypothetical protein
MICLDDKLPWPKVGAPVSDCVDQPNQLALVCCQFGVLWCHLLAEKCNRAQSLMKNVTKTSP